MNKKPPVKCPCPYADTCLFYNEENKSCDYPNWVNKSVPKALPQKADEPLDARAKFDYNGKRLPDNR